MQQWSIGRKLLAAFGCLVTTALIVAAVALWSANALNRRVDQLASVSGRAMQLAADVRFLVADLKARERLVVIATARQDAAVAQTESSEIQAGYDRLQHTIDDLRKVSPSEDVRRRVEGIAEAMTAWSQQWQKTEKFARAQQTLDAADSTDAGRRFSDKATELAGDIGRTEAGFFDADRRAASGIYGITRAAIVGAILLALALATVVGYVVRGISRTLLTSTSELRTSSYQVLNAARQVGRLGPDAVAWRPERGGVARGDLGIDGRDVVDDPAER